VVKLGVHAEAVVSRCRWVPRSARDRIRPLRRDRRTMPFRLPARAVKA